MLISIWITVSPPTAVYNGNTYSSEEIHRNSIMGYLYLLRAKSEHKFALNRGSRCSGDIFYKTRR